MTVKDLKEMNDELQKRIERLLDQHYKIVDMLLDEIRKGGENE